MVYWTNSAVWIVALSSFVLVGACMLLHYEVLSACQRYLPTLTQRRRPRVLILIGLVIVLHITEIWLFGVGYYLLAAEPGFGTVQGLQTTELRDFVYFSGMTYSTVGFGDVVPVGPIRFMAAIEAIAGLVLIAWSASYTYLEMQRHWLSR
jgi:hypothetical protein